MGLKLIFAEPAWDEYVASQMLEEKIWQETECTTERCAAQSDMLCNLPMALDTPNS